MNKPENPIEKRETDLKKADENRQQFKDTVRRMRAQLDRTSLRSHARKPLEKALQHLISRGPSLFDVLNEDDDE